MTCPLTALMTRLWAGTWQLVKAWGVCEQHPEVFELPTRPNGGLSQNLPGAGSRPQFCAAPSPGAVTCTDTAIPAGGHEKVPHSGRRGEWGTAAAPQCQPPTRTRGVFLTAGRALWGVQGVPPREPRRRGSVQGGHALCSVRELPGQASPGPSLVPVSAQP